MKRLLACGACILPVLVICASCTSPKKADHNYSACAITLYHGRADPFNCASTVGLLASPLGQGPIVAAADRIRHAPGIADYTALRITKPQDLQSLVMEPLRRAKAAPLPATHEVVGHLDLVKRDGSSDRYFLYVPWGYLKHGPQSMVADLDALRTRMAEESLR
jgi:hypothetical protein